MNIGMWRIGCICVMVACIAPFLLRASPGTGSPESCPAVSDEVIRQITQYVQKKYRLSDGPRLRLTARTIVDNSCYRRLVFEGDSLPKAFTGILYLSPDGRYLSSDLLDIQKDPIVEEQMLYRETALKLSQGARNTMGPADAPVSIVVFTDLQCPFCKRAAGLLKSELETAEGKRSQLIFRHFPLARHDWARTATEAAECAGFQNRQAFWKMHDLVLENQSILNGSNIREQVQSFAQRVPVPDVKGFAKCMDDGLAVGLIMKDAALGTANQVNATPTIFVAGRRVSVLRSQKDLHDAIVEAIQELGKQGPPSRSTVASGSLDTR